MRTALKGSGNNYAGIQDACTFPKNGTNNLPRAIGTNKLPRVRLKESGLQFTKEFRGVCTFSKIGTINLPGAIGTIKLPQRQINGSSYKACDLNQFFAAIGSNYLPQVQNNRAISDLKSLLVAEFWKLPLPKVQIGS